MGEAVTHFTVYGIELEALVDTAATFTKIPQSIASKLRLDAKYETEVELGDRQKITRKLALAEVPIEDITRPVLLAIGGEDEKPLLGYTTLELLGFRVNPIAGRPEKAVPIEYEERSQQTGITQLSAMILPALNEEETIGKVINQIRVIARGEK